MTNQPSLEVVERCSEMMSYSLVCVCRSACYRLQLRPCYLFEIGSFFKEAMITFHEILSSARIDNHISEFANPLNLNVFREYSQKTHGVDLPNSQKVWPPTVYSVNAENPNPGLEITKKN